eukprot:NODE_361_length_2366_cov_24.774277_g336_i0.p1 GENE.NODE_361_length_2366_cov_24.774277_g336_i0~~NODE_361_length_2366_cov_24.774277_g336_i0.p1  ORF type:complete len:716 (-),score=127.91 NODE_361_length_2366_cov_24.774277_g336_i0:218-2242(-)
MSASIAGSVALDASMARGPSANSRLGTAVSNASVEGSVRFSPPRTTHRPNTDWTVLAPNTALTSQTWGSRQNVETAMTLSTRFSSTLASNNPPVASGAITVITMSFEDVLGTGCEGSLSGAEASLTVVAAHESPLQPLPRMHRLFALQNSESHFAFTFLGLELQVVPEPEPSVEHQPSIRHLLKTPPLAALTTKHLPTLQRIWNRYRAPLRKNQGLTLRLFFKMLVDNLLLNYEEEPPLKRKRVRSKPKLPPIEVDPSPPEKGKGKGAKDSKAKAKPAAAPAKEKKQPVKKKKQEEQEEEPPPPAPKPKPRAVPTFEQLMRRPKVTELMRRILLEIFEEDAVSRITSNPAYCAGESPRAPEPPAEAEPASAVPDIMLTSFHSAIEQPESSARGTEVTDGTPAAETAETAEEGVETMVTDGSGSLAVAEAPPTTATGTATPADDPAVEGQQTGEMAAASEGATSAKATEEPHAQAQKVSKQAVRKAFATANRLALSVTLMDSAYGDLELLFHQFLECLVVCAQVLFPRTWPDRPVPLNCHSLPPSELTTTVPAPPRLFEPDRKKSNVSSVASRPPSASAGGAGGQGTAGSKGNECVAPEVSQRVSRKSLTEQLEMLLDWLERPPIRSRPRTPSPPPPMVSPPLFRRRSKPPPVDPATLKGKGKGKAAAKPAPKKK